MYAGFKAGHLLEGAIQDKCLTEPLRTMSRVFPHTLRLYCCAVIGTRGPLPTSVHEHMQSGRVEVRRLLS